MNAVIRPDAKNPAWVRGFPESDDAAIAQERNDGHLFIQEIRAAAEVHADTILPPEVAELVQPDIQAFQGELTHGHELRLPRAANYDVRGLRGAMQRVLEQARGPVAAPREAVVAERRMLTVIEALRTTQSGILQHGNMNR